MSDERNEQFGLAGVLFFAVGLHDGDTLVLIGCVVWTFACCLWLVPHMRLQAGSGKGSTASNEGSDHG
ncbi:MAG: hypothetical protein AAFR73_08875 [Pseudomonadota bacterium]